MPDQVFVEGLLLRTIIGVNPDERIKEQDVIIDITMDVDARPAGRSDDLADSVDYRAITKNVIALVESSSYFLVEKLAHEIARVCLDDPRVEGVQVRVQKPGAVRFARSVGVQVYRNRADMGAERSS
jgi:dihydroneopterin aldolase/D-erythro-7,8-dihydroneopterin triphosphate epimerase